MEMELEEDPRVREIEMEMAPLFFTTLVPLAELTMRK